MWMRGEALRAKLFGLSSRSRGLVHSIALPRQVPHEVREGTVLAGKYLVEQTLGAGGMGVVVAAHHVQLDQRVALKFLLPEVCREPDAISRFEREAWATAKIKSEHVVRVSDVGTLQSGEPFIVMEYLDGLDLASLLEPRGRLALDEAVDYLLQA
jgi:serine/threonine-protein kinase